MFSTEMLDPSSAEHYYHRGETRSSMDSSAPPVGDRPPSIALRTRDPKKLILCFDGTGNKFHGDESDSNILKIFRMLDRTANDQYHYYQPGIGTYVISTSLSRTSLSSRVRSWYQKAKDSAVGSSFDQHVVGGYRFLMRFYNPGDEIYMFGFSRGAYIARFLAEMLDHIGLLCHGNEEMVSFAWKAFSQWQCRPGGGGGHDRKSLREERKKIEMYEFMKGFRETFSRPVGRIRFLGLFDTVNSVPRFETAWMQRSKFPYTARSSAKVIRHAVSIDERRAKFRQDLIYQQSKRLKRRRHLHDQIHDHLHDHWEQLGEIFEGRGRESQGTGGTVVSMAEEGVDPASARGRTPNREESPSGNDAVQYAPYRPRSRSPPWQRRQSNVCGDGASEHWAMDDQDEKEERGDKEEREDDQDIDEVWFSGGHGDIGGGWQLESDGKNSSHVPLVWMVREAMRAGLPFDVDKVREMDCLDVYTDHRKRPESRPARPSIFVSRESEEGSEHALPLSPDPATNDEEPEERAGFLALMHDAHCARIHDSLAYGGGLGFMAVTAWKMMEWLPFRRMDLQADGSWKPISWPLPRGEVRDIPDNVRVHGSVIRRMREDPTYRPGNLIVGGGGRGIRVAPEAYEIGFWKCVADEGDPVGEIWVRDGKPPGLEACLELKKARKNKKGGASSEKGSETVVGSAVVHTMRP
ncbi:Uncharacterized protein ESCO_005313 [Escovopsis weberi]|uniref:T6SS Phospholipase effector Tle1-like catalytic domain-containing protein n=1 Tax=Escovopsis weberi TaxID=150374 RepID=A0A0M8N5K8_ESCWE|nr:Uncharacterized protein ESCO_005313 [Escovopsis weberi]